MVPGVQTAEGPASALKVILTLAWVAPVRLLEPCVAVVVPPPVWQMVQAVPAMLTCAECERLLFGKTAPFGKPSVALAPWQSQQDDVPDGTFRPWLWHPVQLDHGVVPAALRCREPLNGKAWPPNGVSRTPLICSAGLTKMLA